MNSSKVDEASLYEIWRSHNFAEPLKTIGGEGVEILDPGSFNEDLGGPDFKNARIRIGSLTYVGDVEIDTNYHDWKAHGHNINNKYNKVILHISLFNKFKQAYVYSKDGRKIPNAPLYTCLGDEYLTLISSAPKKTPSARKQSIKCSYDLEGISSDDRIQFVKSLGVKRFQKKCSKIYSRLKELSFIKTHSISEPDVKYQLSPEFINKEFTYDDFKGRELWEQLFYELLFEALGYTQNKRAMQNLSIAANLDYFRSLEVDANYTPKLESALFNIAGLMPNVAALPQQEVSEYSKLLTDLWGEFKNRYDGKTFNETDWHFFRLRPINFPTIRIVGGIRLLKALLNDNLIGTMIKKIVEIRNDKILINSLRSLFVVKSDGYWQNHYVFDKPASSPIKYFVGSGRADEIMVNVVLPYFAVYFEVFGKEVLSKKVLQLFNIYEQRNENRIVSNVAESLKIKEISSKTIYAQGMIELFRSYCTKNRCEKCEIGKVVFK